MTLNDPFIIDRQSGANQPIQQGQWDIAQLPFTLSPSPLLALRAINHTDQAFLTDLYAVSRPELEGLRSQGAVFDQLMAMQMRAQQLGLASTFPDAQQLVIERQQQAVGKLVVDWGDADVRVVDIAVALGARRSGVARAVLVALQHAAAAAGLRVSLAVATSNAPAQALYRGLGFQVKQQDALFEQLVWQAAA
jgi:ribosomal protein S18 acetylase RimI-like enzyme